MLSFRSVFGTEQESARLFSISSDIASDGFKIQVGRSVNAETIHIPQSVLKTCSLLNSLLVPGCRIVNADPTVFAIIIEHLKFVSNLGLLSFNAPGHLQELTLSNALLNFAKAWHVGDMLRMPVLQSDVLKVYRAYYLKCLDNHFRLPLDTESLDPRPFAYLRDNIGYHTKAEKFIVDFHAGLMQNQVEFKRDDLKLLPTDIAVTIRNRWHELSGRARRDSTHSKLSKDRIATRDRIYMIAEDDKIRHSDLQIQYLYAGVGSMFGLNPPLSEPHDMAVHASGRSVSRHGNRLEDLAARRKRYQEMRLGPESRETLPKSNLSNPLVGSASKRKGRAHSRSISPTALLSTHDRPAAGNGPLAPTRPRRKLSHHRSLQRATASLASELPSQAPFASDSPGRGCWLHQIGDREATGVECVYERFALETFGALNFAA